jgi:hypothetical protein
MAEEVVIPGHVAFPIIPLLSVCASVKVKVPPDGVPELIATLFIPGIVMPPVGGGVYVLL